MRNAIGSLALILRRGGYGRTYGYQEKPAGLADHRSTETSAWKDKQMRSLTLTSALALGLAFSGAAFAQSNPSGCAPKAHNTQGYPQGLNNSSQPHPRFTQGEQTGVNSGNRAQLTAGEQTGVDSGNRARLTAGGGGVPGAVQSSEQPHPRFTAGEQTGVDSGNRARLTAGGGGIPGGVYDSSQPHPRFTAGQQQQFAQAGSAADPCK